MDDSVEQVKEWVKKCSGGKDFEEIKINKLENAAQGKLSRLENLQNTASALSEEFLEKLGKKGNKLDLAAPEFFMLFRGILASLAADYLICFYTFGAERDIDKQKIEKNLRAFCVELFDHMNERLDEIIKHMESV